MTEKAPGRLSGRERIDRVRARAWALHVLYRWEAEEAERPLEAVLDDVLRTRRIAERRLPLLRRLLVTIERERASIDQALTEVTRNWRLERLSRIDRTILRIASAEILFLEDVPPKVAIQEAVHLARDYGGLESPAFVNGVLDAVYHRFAPAR